MAGRRVVALVGVVAAVVALGAAALTYGTTSASADAPTGGIYHALQPVRLLDTRSQLGGSPAGPFDTVQLLVLGHGGVPASNVSAVVLNVTVTAPTASGVVTVYADGTSRPTSSNLNFLSRQTVPNLVVAPVGSDGIVDLYNHSTGTTQLIADVSGYFTGGTALDPGTFTALAPARLMDTRSNLGAKEPGPQAEVKLAVDGHGGVPSTGVAAVAINVTVTQPSASGFVTVWGDGTARPGTSNLDFGRGQTVPNLVVAPVGSDGDVDLFNGSAGSTQLIADVSGYFLAGTPTDPGALHTLPPSRLLDTRIKLGGAVVGGRRSLSLQVLGRGAIPSSAVRSVVLNVTVTDPATDGFITAYADGSPVPTASNLNFDRAQTVPNLVIAPVGANGRVDLYNGSPGSVQLVADVYGYYLGAPGEPGGSCAGFTNSTGITDTTITLANASDISGPVPGLYGSAQQATQAYLAYFNSVADICGRSLSLETLDTQTSATADQQASATACSTAFAMVGSMSAFDDGGAQTAAQCGIPDIRTQPSTTTRQDAPDTYAAGYGDVEQIAAAVPLYFVQNDPSAVSSAALLYLNAGGTSLQAQNEIKGWTDEGFHFVYTAGIDVTAFNYTTYVSNMQQKGVKYVQFDGAYQYAIRLAQTMQAQHFTPIFVLGPSAYDPGFVSSGGAAVNGAYVFTNAALFEEAASNPEMQLYEHWLQIVAPGATPSYLGLFAWSAGMLFTQEALTLGGNLNRSTLLTALSTVHSWTGNGLFSAEDVGNKITSGCTAIIQLDNQAWVRRSASPYVCGPIVQFRSGE